MEKYGILPNIPQLAFLNERILLGRREVMNAESIIQNLSYNPCPLYPRFMNFSEISLSGLPGRPKVWANKKVIVPSGHRVNESVIKGLVETEDVVRFLESHSVEFEIVQPKPIQISKGEISFSHAVRVDSWLIG